jgi:hypothetical protein
VKLGLTYCFTEIYYLNNFRLSKAKQSIAALCMLFFVVYCSAGVCTNWISSSSNSSSITLVEASVQGEHAHHAEHQIAQQGEQNAVPNTAHCESSGSSGCEWSVNPTSADLFSAESESPFFFHYMLVTTVLALMVLLRQLGQHARFAFARSQFFPSGYPRLHLQKSVFLN